MNSPTQREAELVLTITLGSSIAVYRPSFLADSSTSTAWMPLAQDTDLSIQSPNPYHLRVRLVAQDGLGNPIVHPAWMVQAYTMGSNGLWQPLSDRDSSSPHFLTDSHFVSATTRHYRFTVTIPNSGIETTFGFSISAHDASGNEGDDIVVLDDDFGPSVGDGDGDTPSAPLVAGDLAAPL